MKVKITKGKHWYVGMEGEILEVFEDHLDYEDHADLVYSLVEDFDEVTIRYIEPANCVLVPDEPDELTRLRSALARTQAALDAAGELLELSSYIAISIEGLDGVACEHCHRQEHKENCEWLLAKQAYTAAMAALVSARGTETG